MLSQYHPGHNNIKASNSEVFLWSKQLLVKTSSYGLSSHKRFLKAQNKTFRCDGLKPSTKEGTDLGSVALLCFIGFKQPKKIQLKTELKNPNL